MPKLRKVEPVYGVIAYRIRKARRSQEMTQEELARRVRITRTSLVNFEAGRQRCMLHHIAKMAQTLGIQVRFP